MIPDISEMRENPRFVEELGHWEGFMTPLKAAHKTHVLKIEHPALGPIFLQYVPGDFIRQYFPDEVGKTLTVQWEFELVKWWLENYPVEFVRK